MRSSVTGRNGRVYVIRAARSKGLFYNKMLFVYYQSLILVGDEIEAL